MTSESGYTYAGLLIVLVALSLAAQATSIPSSSAAQRAAEQELVHRGMSYARAIESYWLADPETPEFPPTLEALLDDPRKTGRRHIRRLVEPVIANEWRIITADTGGIAGVSPRSDKTAFWQKDLPMRTASVDNPVTYADWHFVFEPGAAE